MNQIESYNISNFDIDEFIFTNTDKRGNRYEILSKLKKLTISDEPYNINNKLISTFNISLELFIDIQNVKKCKEHHFGIDFTHTFNHFIENICIYQNLINVKYTLIKIVSTSYVTKKSVDNYKVFSIKISHYYVESNCI